MRLGARQLGRWCLDPALSWQVQRRRLYQLTRAFLLPRGTTVARHVIGGVPAEVVSSPGADPRRTVIHFHGGGYCLGSASMVRSWAAHLSVQAGCRVVLPEYRLAPEHPHPAALEDAHAVMTALAGQAPRGMIAVSGDSAGGGLALALVLRMRDEGQELPAKWPRMWHDFALQPGLLAAADSALAQAAWFAGKVMAARAPANWLDGPAGRWLDGRMTTGQEQPRVVSVSREIAAGPGPIFELIADPAQQPRWDGNDNLAEAAAGQRVRRAGDVFRMTLTQGQVRENHVVEFDEGRLIAWTPAEPGQEPPGHLWRWELEPAGASRTRVTSTYDWTRLTDETRLPRARATTVERLRASLDLLAALAESPEPSQTPEGS